MHNFMNWLADRPARMFGAFGVVTVLAFGGLAYLDIQEQKQWDAFAQAHACKKIAHQDGYTMYGYHNGKYQSFWVSSKDTYRCNDGVDYTR